MCISGVIELAPNSLSVLLQNCNNRASPSIISSTLVFFCISILHARNTQIHFLFQLILDTFLIRICIIYCGPMEKLDSLLILRDYLIYHCWQHFVLNTSKIVIG